MHFLLLLLFTLTVDEGPIVDPNGGRHVSAADHHCSIDPNGNCLGGLGEASTDGRSILDPLGGAASASSDRGAGLDPNG